MINPIQQVQRLGQAIWYDNIRRGLFTSGELRHLVELGISGLTSNPTIFEKAIAGSTDYGEAMIALTHTGETVGEIYETLAVEDIRGAADLLRPIYDRTSAADGYACLEVSPALAHDTDGTVAEAMRLFAVLGRPNVMVKVPATPEGIPAIRRLIGEGVNVNVTLIFSLETYQHVMDAYIAGLEDLDQRGGDVDRVASVASFFVSRVDTAIDALLEEYIRRGHQELKSLLGKAAVANAKLAYQAFKHTFGGERFAALRAKGSRVQRPLWASTGAKNPAYSDVLYVESLIGSDTVNTMPPATITAFLEHGHVDATLEQDVTQAQETVWQLAEAGIGMEQVTAKLLADGVKAFADSFEKLMVNISEKKARLLSREHIHLGVDLGAYLPEVETGLGDLQQRNLVGRIWNKDHTLWKPDPTEITNRLGWLTVTEFMCEQVSTLEGFSRDVRNAGFQHIVLLGMGGSSLGAKVLVDTFGKIGDYPELLVLDSIVPAWVRAVTEIIDPERTLFLVSSKSGDTIEPLSLYKHFRGLVERRMGKERAGENFVAITDPETPLERLAQEQGFRHLFLNPSDIGGRYSVLSYFGLVPAAAFGVNVVTLLDRADCMREGCASCVPAHENPGAWLGATIGILALQGHDKLTLVTSPSISSFGLWAEQLVAESTGKEGKGIVPVVGEPLVAPPFYGDDRLFVYLRLEGDDNAKVDAAMAGIQASGRPVLRLELRDRYDLGAEFFRWQFATAIAGAILGINPFDQPNVQAAKDATDRVLAEYKTTGRLPRARVPSSLKELLLEAKPRDYLAIMAYLSPTQEVDQALTDLRHRVMEQYRIATTVGYGPRFLHSTGQLHKGGPNVGLFLQLTTDNAEALPIGDEPNTFDTLADAQALGDLQALQSSGRCVAVVPLGSDSEAGIRRLLGQLT